jgi:hypothetical protein
MKAKRADLLEEEYEDKCAKFADQLSQTWERIISVEIADQLYNQGTGKVSSKMVRVLGMFSEDDVNDFQTGYGRTGGWTRHDQNPAKNYVAPTLDELDEEYERIKAFSERIKKYRYTKPS